MTEISVAAAAFILVASHWVVLTGPDDISVIINTDQIVSLREPRNDAERVVHKNAHCIVFLTDGKFIAVTEDCRSISLKIYSTDEERPR